MGQGDQGRQYPLAIDSGAAAREASNHTSILGAVPDLVDRHAGFRHRYSSRMPIFLMTLPMRAISDFSAAPSSCRRLGNDLHSGMNKRSFISGV